MSREAWAGRSQVRFFVFLVEAGALQVGGESALGFASRGRAGGRAGGSRQEGFEVGGEEGEEEGEHGSVFSQ